MIDDPHQARRLIAKLASSLPLPAIVTPELAGVIRERSPGIDLSRGCIVTKTFYAGDDGGTRDALLARHNRYRAINIRLQTELAKKLLKRAVAPMARRLGIIKTEKEAIRRDPGDLGLAAELALYATDADGTNAVRRYAREAGDRLPDIDRRVLEA